MKKLLLLLTSGLLFFTMSLGLLAGTIASETKKEPTWQGKIKVLKTQPSIPVSIVIPKLGVKTTVEQVGLTPTGEMDVPSTDYTTGWYSLGARPGQKGSAVIAGHFDALAGGPGVFYGLFELDTGDKVYITDAKGEEYTFEVIRIRVYSDNGFPLEEVFSEKSSKKLNLITCDGVFDEAANEYADRLVVYTELVDEKRVISNI